MLIPKTKNNSVGEFGKHPPKPNTAAAVYDQQS